MIHIEHTDLFGGEANYSWVRRHTIEESDLTDNAIVRRAKKLAGLTGLRCKVEKYGDMIKIDASPAGLLHVVFVTFQ